MITESDIAKFYEDFRSMKLVKPVSVMMTAAGVKSSGTVSQYLSGVKTPSEKFIRAFYEKVFKPSTNALSNSSLDDELPLGDLKITLRDYLLEIKQQKEFLQELLSSKIKEIDTNLNIAVGGVRQLSLHVESAREVVLESLARLEKKPKGSLTGAADKIVAQLMKEHEKQGSIDGGDK